MVYCGPLAFPLQKHIEEMKTLDEIGLKICGDTVKNPRRKAIRMIRLLLGQKWLDNFSSSLHYDVDKANLSKNRNRAPQRKGVIKEECSSSGMPQQCTAMCEEDKINHMDYSKTGDNELSRVVEAVNLIISRHGEDLLMQALVILKIIAPSAKEIGTHVNDSPNLDDIHLINQSDDV